MTMELKIFSPTDDGFVKSIEWNHEELKAEMERQLERYQGLAYTDDTISDAKSDRATLNKLKNALNDKRKELKKRCLEPYTTFETQVKELIALVDKPMLAIDGQVKGYEERRRSEKQAEIQKIWDSNDSNVKTLVSLDRIFDPRWLNVGSTLKKVEEAIIEFLERTEKELATIEELKTEFEDQVIRVYLQSFSIADALAENTKLLEQKAKREEYKRQQEEAAKARREALERAQAEARQKAEAQAAQDIPQQTEAPAAPKPEAQPEVTTEEPMQMDFRVWATRGQLQALRQFLTENNIRYGRVEDRQAA